MFSCPISIKFNSDSFYSRNFSEIRFRLGLCSPAWKAFREHEGDSINPNLKYSTLFSRNVSGLKLPTRYFGMIVKSHYYNRNYYNKVSESFIDSRSLALQMRQIFWKSQSTVIEILQTHFKSQNHRNPVKSLLIRFGPSVTISMSRRRYCAICESLIQFNTCYNLTIDPH